MQFDDISNKVLGCAITVHRELGPGLLESAYQHCLMRELQLADIPFRYQCGATLRPLCNPLIRSSISSFRGFRVLFRAFRVTHFLDLVFSCSSRGYYP